MEKILRVQPNVKKLYLLLRARDTESATQRLHAEVNVQRFTTINIFFSHQEFRIHHISKPNFTEFGYT